jgi:hypothetical protein
MYNRNVDEKGFTVIELIIVVFGLFALLFLIFKRAYWFYPVVEIWQYIIFYIVLYFFQVFIYAFAINMPLARMYLKKVDYNFENLWSRKEGKILKALKFLSTTFLFVAFFITYFELSYFGIHFPNNSSRNDIVHVSQTSTDNETDDIDRRAKQLSKSINKIDELTLSEIKGIVDELAVFIQEYQTIGKQQSEKIASLKQVAIEANNKAERAKKLLETIKSLTKPELEAIKLIITEDATIQSRRSFLLGVSFSFPIGILSSLIASWIMQKIVNEKLTMRLQSDAQKAAVRHEV